MSCLGNCTTLALICLAWGCAPAGESPASDPTADLHALFDEAWSFQMAEDPLDATWVGIHDYDDRLPSVSPADEVRRAEYWQDVGERLAAIDRAALDAGEQINYDLFERQVSDRVASFELEEYLIPITAESGFHTAFALLPEQVPLATVEDFENYVSRLRAFPTYVDQYIEVMRLGISEGYVLPRAVLEGYESTIDAHIVEEVSESVFWKPFEQFPTTVPVAEHERLRVAGEAAIVERVIPGYEEFLRFMVGEYLPNTRESLGASELPKGRELYDYLIRHHTTLDLTADEVHQIGLDEVARIRAEMSAVIEQVKFDGSFEDFVEFLRTDPRFYPKTAEELLKEASFIAKKMDGKLPALLKTLPRLPYGVEPVPEHLAPKYTAGRYVPAPVGSTKAGTYWVNTHALESRPLYALTALTLHEAVPGHHLQNALRQELEDLPSFRRFSGVNAYGEGWALYSERLGLEVGFYEDPYDNFGRLTYEIWRACRLVVDTGVHAKGWTRQQMIDYLAANTALSLHEITTETDRYISWPGQALAYKIGELEIRKLRAQAEEALGERFDIRQFHDVILRNGPLPLPVLGDQVEAFIEEVQSSS